MNLSPIDTFSLILYLAGMLALGIFFSKRQQSTESYFLGNRQFSGWVIGLSLVGTSISSVTFLAYPADGFKTAWLRYLPNLVLPLVALAAIFIFLPVFRRHKLTTAYEYLELRFGPSIRVYGATAFIIAQIVRISTILYLVAILLHELTGMSTSACIMIAGFFVAAYTIIGGIDAVIWTDVIQTVILILGGCLVLGIVIQKLPGGIYQIFQVATEHQKLSLSEWNGGSPKTIRWDFSLLGKTGTMMLLLGLTNWLTEYSSNQNVVQRYLAAKSTQEARKAVWICTLTSLPIWAFYMFLGTALYVFYLQFPSPMATEILEGTQKAERILPWFILQELPTGIVGIVIAAALAAAMSSLDSSINAISTVGIHDLYRRHFKKSLPDSDYLKMAKVIAALSSLLMIFGAIAILNTETKTLQDLATILVSLLGGGLLGLYLIALSVDQCPPKAAWTGIGATMIFTAYTIAVKNNWIEGTLPFDLYYTTIIANLIMIAGILTGKILFRKKQQMFSSKESNSL